MNAPVAASEPTNEARTQRIILLLRLLRLLLALTGTSYIHPDEHFQNTEIAHGLVFAGPQSKQAWEWNPARPCRSIVPVWLTTGWAYALLSIFSAHPSARTLFLTERLAMVLVSLACELLAKLILGVQQHEDDMASLLFNFSGAALVFLTRPLSNSLSALLLLPLLALVKNADRGIVSAVQLDILWAICAIGVWTRFDFAAFAAPAVLAVIWRHISRAKSLLHATVTLRVQTALFVVAILIGCDTRFFASPPRPSWRPVLTPLNSLLYNLSSINVAEHGLHPRWLHIVINWPMLFGLGLPLAVGAAWKQRQDSLSRVYAMMLFIATALLSLSPHQEPRFLLPCLAALCHLLARSGRVHIGFRRWQVLCLLHALLVVIFFGFLHQGGLLPALMHVEQRLHETDKPISIVVWKAYMPPPHLTLPTVGSSIGPHELNDLAGAAWSSVRRTLSRSSTKIAWLVVPVYKVPQTDCLSLLSTHWPHIDPDHIGDIVMQGLSSAAVGVYEVDVACMASAAG